MTHTLRQISFDSVVADSAFHREAPQFGDYCSHDGALILKQRIEAFWCARGLQVNVSLAGAGFDSAVRAARFDVRSDLVNGLPRKG